MSLLVYLNFCPLKSFAPLANNLNDQTKMTQSPVRFWSALSCEYIFDLHNSLVALTECLWLLSSCKVNLSLSLKSFAASKRTSVQLHGPLLKKRPNQLAETQTVGIRPVISRLLVWTFAPFVSVTIVSLGKTLPQPADGQRAWWLRRMAANHSKPGNLWIHCRLLPSVYGCVHEWMNVWM